ncbi:uncharacterized protein METZ01_LOCUS355891, partial [marine metagenome]
MNQTLSDVVNMAKYPLHDESFRSMCKSTLDEDGVLVMSNFLN